MDWQLATTFFAVGIAGVYLAWRGWRTVRASKSGCAGGCGCANSKPAQEQTPKLIGVDEIGLRTKP